MNTEQINKMSEEQIVEFVRKVAKNGISSSITDTSACWKDALLRRKLIGRVLYIYLDYFGLIEKLRGLGKGIRIELGTGSNGNGYVKSLKLYNDYGDGYNYGYTLDSYDAIDESIKNTFSRWDWDTLLNEAIGFVNWEYFPKNEKGEREDRFGRDGWQEDLYSLDFVFA